MGILISIIGAFCLRTAVIFARLTEDLGIATIAFSRLFFVFLFFIVLLTKISELLRLKDYKNSVKTLLCLGVLIGMTVTLYGYAIQDSTAASAAIRVNSSPIYVVMLASFVLIVSASSAAL